MLHNHHCRPCSEVLQDIEGIIHVCEVNLSRMLSALEHTFFCNSRNQTIPRFDKSAVTQSQVTAYELVERSFLPRIFTVPKSLFNKFTCLLIRNLPRPLPVYEHLITITNRDFRREMVIHYRAIHFLEIIAHYFLHATCVAVWLRVDIFCCLVPE